MTFVLTALLAVYVLPALATVALLRGARRRRERLAAREQIGNW